MRAILFSIILSSIWSPSRAQTPSADEKVFSLNLPGNPLFSQCGLITRVAPDLQENISPSCLQNINNAYLDSNGSIDRRGGIAAYNITAIAGATVKGLWEFDATNGTRYLIAFSSNSMYSSPQNGTFTVINPDGKGDWNLTATAEMECAQLAGKLYCTDGTDTPFFTDVVSSGPNTNAPLAPHMGIFRNRLVFSGVSGTTTDIYLSGELGPTDWTIPAVQTSTNAAILSINGVNDGLSVNCVMGEYQNQFLIGRNYDLWALSGYNLNDFTLRQISSQVGCIQAKSVQEVNNQKIWMSKRGIESFSGTQITPISYYIKPTIDQIITAAGNSQNQTINNNTPFSSGILCASGPKSCSSTTINPGFVVNTTWSVTDAFPSSFQTLISSVNTSTSSLGMSLTATPTVTAFNLSGLNGGSSCWQTAGFNNGIGLNNNPNCGNGSFYTAFVASTTLAYGEWTSTMTAIGKTNVGVIDWYFISDGHDVNGNGAFNGYSVKMDGLANNGSFTIYLGKHNSSQASGADTVLASTVINPNVTVGTCDFKIIRDGLGNFTVTVGASGNPACAPATLTANDTQYITNIYQNFSGTWNNNGGGNLTEPNLTFDTTPYSFYPASGYFMSAQFDTGISTTVGGPFTVAFSSNPSTTLAFGFRQGATLAALNSAAFTSIPNYQNNPDIATTQEFIQYVSSFTTVVTTATAFVNSVNLIAETTSYYISPAILVSTPTSWGNFNFSGVTNGGAFTFYISTGATAAIASNINANWTQQNPNAIISVTTSTAYVAARVLFNVDVATETPTLQSMTVNWNSGSSRPPVSSLQYNDRYYLFYTTSTLVGSSNDHALVYDFNNKWTLLDDVRAYSATLYLNQPYIGDSTATGKVYQMESGQSDNGGNYQYSFTTSDLDLNGNPAQLKDLHRFYLFVNQAANSAQSIAITCNYSIDGDNAQYPLQSSTLSSSPAGYAVVKYQFPTNFPNQAHWVNVSCSNSGASGPISVYGFQLVYQPDTWN